MSEKEPKPAPPPLDPETQADMEQLKKDAEALKSVEDSIADANLNERLIREEAEGRFRR